MSDYETNELIKEKAVKLLVEDGFDPAMAAQATEFSDSKLALIQTWKNEIEAMFPTSEGRFLAMGLLFGSMGTFFEGKQGEAAFCLKMARLGSLVRKASSND